MPASVLPRGGFRPRHEKNTRPLWPPLLAALTLVRRRLRRRRRGARDAARGHPDGHRGRRRGQIPEQRRQRQVSLKIGSKNFTEQKVLGEIYAQGLAAAGYTTSTDLNLGDQETALAALKGGQIDAYPEYTGTALTAFFSKDAADLPKDANAAYEELKSAVRAGRHHGVPADAVHQLQRGRGDAGDGREVRPHEDLRPQQGRRPADALRHARVPQAHGLPARPAGGLRAEVQEVHPGRPAQRHEVLQSGRADVSIVFTTDPQIKRNKEVLLKDDKGMFPPYNPTLVMKTETADKAGAGPGQDDRPDPEAADRRRDAGARRARRPGQEGARPRSPRSTSRDRASRSRPRICSGGAGRPSR